jgi:hypothetical protein
MSSFKCTDCNYESKRKYNLQRHIQSKHTKVKELCKKISHRCSICEYSTDRPYNLKRHEATHKRIKKTRIHKCFICDYENKSKSNVKKHVDNHESKIKLEMARLRGLRNRYQGRVNKPTVERFDKQGNIIKVTIDYKSLLEHVITDFDKIKKDHYKYISTNAKDRIITKLVNKETDIYSETSTDNESEISQHDYKDIDTEDEPVNTEEEYSHKQKQILLRMKIKGLKRRIINTEDDNQVEKLQKELNNLCKELI